MKYFESLKNYDLASVLSATSGKMLTDMDRLADLAENVTQTKVTNKSQIGVLLTEKVAPYALYKYPELWAATAVAKETDFQCNWDEVNDFLQALRPTHGDNFPLGAYQLDEEYQQFLAEQPKEKLRHATIGHSTEATKNY